MLHPAIPALGQTEPEPLTKDQSERSVSAIRIEARASQQGPISHPHSLAKSDEGVLEDLARRSR
jgi:hypothetical protein